MHEVPLHERSEFQYTYGITVKPLFNQDNDKQVVEDVSRYISELMDRDIEWHYEIDKAGRHHSHGYFGSNKNLYLKKYYRILSLKGWRIWLERIRDPVAWVNYITKGEKGPNNEYMFIED